MRLSRFDQWLTTEPDGPHALDDEVGPDHPDPCPECDWVGGHGRGCKLEGKHGRPLRNGGYCLLDEDHRGRCSSVTFYCDGCGKYRRSQPVAQVRNEHDGVVEAQLCFMCEHVRDEDASWRAQPS